MKRKPLNYASLRGLWVLIVGCMFVFNSCEKETTPNEPKEDIKTVSVNEALRFLETHQSQRKVKSGKEPYVTPDADNIHHEEITNSNEKMTVIPATTVNQGDYSRILMLKFKEELKTVVFSMYPDECSTDSIFSGKIFVTDLEGKFISGYRISDGRPISRFVLKKNQRKVKSGDDDTIDGGTFDEVLVIAERPEHEYPISKIIEPDYSLEERKNWKYRGGGGGSSNNGGSSGDGEQGAEGVEAPEEIKKEPCEQATTIGKHKDTKALMKILQGKTSENKEYGYVLKADGSKINGRAIVGGIGEKGIDFQITEDYVDGYIHSHYKNLLPIFSPDDIFAIVSIYKQGKIRDLNTFVAGVVTEQGTQYLLVINEPGKFMMFAQNLYKGFDFSEKTLNAYERMLHDLYQIDPKNSAKDNELNFVRFLQQNKTGLKLLKGSKDLNSWAAKNLDKNNKIVSTDC